MFGTLPRYVVASTYSDWFVDREVADSTPMRVDRYTHKGFTAALLGEHRGAVHFGTKLLITYRGRSVVVIVNDVGKGKEGQDRVLDLSRTAMAYLLGRKVDQVTETNASLINLDTISVVNGVTPVGPVGAK